MERKMLTVNFVVVLNKIQVVLLSSHPSQRFYSISQERIFSLTRKSYDQKYHWGLIRKTQRVNIY